ncbi:hypothetical protein Ate01nite_09280 [Actinoplanes teichomyceticus]|nr:hypothetical protein Ate01nite_09280 [Actinoplanes teichomyceticus]
MASTARMCFSCLAGDRIAPGGRGRTGTRVPVAKWWTAKVSGRAGAAARRS